MSRRVEYGPLAKIDLFDIYEYIANDNPPAARRMVEAINKTCETIIVENPFIGRTRERLSPHIRSFTVRPYIIFYIPTDDTIDVIRVLHGARDIDTILAP